MCLGCGDTASQPGGKLADVRLADRLEVLIKGGKRHLNGAADLNADARAQEEASVGDTCTIREGRFVNVDVTSPGATLALGLAFMQTNNESVARRFVLMRVQHVVVSYHVIIESHHTNLLFCAPPTNQQCRLSIPSTQFELDYCRPDFVLLRVLARSLILWRSIQPSEEWVQAQVPPFIHKYASVAPHTNRLPRGSDVGFCRRISILLSIILFIQTFFFLSPTSLT
jgi:anaphase-promoting complex subunit 1